jgi:hypothetical protein
VVVEVAVRRANQIRGDRVAKQDAHYPVLLTVGMVFIEGHQHQCVVHEIAVVQERF